MRFRLFAGAGLVLMLVGCLGLLGYVGVDFSGGELNLYVENLDTFNYLLMTLVAGFCISSIGYFLKRKVTVRFTDR